MALLEKIKDFFTSAPLIYTAPPQPKPKQKINVPDNLRGAFGNAYRLYPELRRGSLETIAMMESSLGADTRNQNADFGQYGYLTGLTKTGHWKQVLDNAKKDPTMKSKYRVLNQNVQGIDDLSTPESALAATASVLASLKKNNPGLSDEEIYFKFYNANPEVDRPDRRKKFTETFSSFEPEPIPFPRVEIKKDTFAQGLKNYFEPANQVRIRDVLREVPKATKDIFLPTRGFSEEELAEAKPGVKEKLQALPRVVAEIASLGELIPVSKGSGAEKLLKTKLGNTLADWGEKIAGFAKPETPEEAKAMRFVDVASIIPVGSLKVAPTVATAIAKSKNFAEIASLLLKEVKGLSDDAARGLGIVLAEIDNVDDVQRVLNKVDFALNQVKQAPEVRQTLGLPETVVKETKYDTSAHRALGGQGDMGWLDSIKLPTKSPLTQEARKYKSAEEFVKAQGEPLYHGTSVGSADNISKNGFVVTKGGMNAGNGISLTPDVNVANIFGENGKTVEAVLAKDAKLVTPSDFIDTKNAIGEKSGFETATQKTIDFYKAKGYDGVDFRKGSGNISDALKNEVRIWNPEKLQTKSQLTDFYNQAVKPKPLSQVDQLIAENKIRVVSRDGRDVYQIKKAGEWVNTRDEDSAIRQVTAEKLPEKTPEDFDELDIEIDQTSQSLDDLQTIVDEHKGKPLMKYVSRTTGELPEVTGKKTMQSLTGSGKIVKISEFGRRGDDIVHTELARFNFEDIADAQKAVDEYQQTRKKLDETKQYHKNLLQTKKEKELLKKDTQQATKFLERVASLTDKEIEVEARKQAKLKIERVQQRAKERREVAHRDLRELEQSIYRMTSEIVKETPAFQSQAILEANKAYIEEIPTLPKIVIDTSTNVKKKVGLLDYFRTPDRVLSKIGLGAHAKMLRNAYDNYVAELPGHIDLIREWKNILPNESNKRIFRWLDGQSITLNKQELAVGTEIKEYLADWAERLNLPEDNRIASYITHIFEPDFIKKEFDEELAKIISDKVAGSVYDPFLEKRLGKRGYIEDTWRALEAYAKRAVRKSNIDPALEPIKEASERLEQSQFDYVKRYIDRVNLRPTKLDNLADNTIKQIAGYRFGQRPTASITRLGRQMVYRGALGLNFGSALKNLTQGINTYATLGEKYTAIGYIKLLTNIGSDELKQVGVLKQDIIQDKIVSAGKNTLQKLDKALFSLFEMAETINRGAAYWGAKAKAINSGLSEIAAIDYAKKVVRDTQFTYSSVDAPVALSSDLAKTFLQFGTFSIKQTEFLTELLKNKNWTGFLRYTGASLFIVYAVGEAFNIDLQTFNPLNFFARFGRPATLALPSEIVKAIVDSPGYFGQKRDLSEKIEDVLKSSLIYIPGGIQAQKTYRGLKKYKGTEKTVGDLLKATTLGSKNLEETGSASSRRLDEIRKKYNLDKQSTSKKRLQEIREKYGIK